MDYGFKLYCKFIVVNKELEYNIYKVNILIMIMVVVVVVMVYVCFYMRGFLWKNSL